MKIVVRYLNQKSLAALFFSFILFTFILLIDQVFQLLNLALTRGVNIFSILRLLFLSLPGVFSFSVPMAALLTVLILFGELSSNNELNILRGTGLNHWQIIRTYCLLVIILMATALFINHFWLPRTYREFRRQYFQILQNQPLLQINQQSVTQLKDYFLYPTEVDSKNNYLKGVVIYKSEPNNWPVRITARTARVFSRGNRIVFSLDNGYWLRINHNQPGELVILKFQHYLLSILLPTIFGEVSDLRQLGSRELLEKAKNSPPAQKNIFLTEYYLRWGLGLAVAFLSFVGLPLATRLEKGGRAISFGVSLGIIFGYYLLLIGTMNLSEKNFWPAAMILVIPNLAMTLPGYCLWKEFLRR